VAGGAGAGAEVKSEIRNQKSEATTVGRQKAEVRAEIRQRLRRLSAEERAAKSAQACEWLRQQTIWRRAKTVLFYAPLGDELDLTPLFADCESEGRRIALPGFDAAQGNYAAWFIADRRRDLVAGKFGILEPAAHCRLRPVERVDLILVPGVAFTPDGRRLGRGKGFYDRLLSQVAGWRCGVALDFQVREELPCEPHDLLMDCLLTPERWRECRPPAVGGK
jgi:5-formyltetrahydrofolate cyclo-ligase